MNIEDFQIGKEFWLKHRDGFVRWMCTDKGTRVVTALCLDNHPDDPSWFNGPPYAVVEHVVDEDSMNICYPEKPKE